ncbi:18184_t:CDS:2, partial [Dentiscutata erythropus]
NKIHEFIPARRIKQPSYSLMATWQYEIENDDYIELADNIKLIDLTNEETAWVKMEDIDNIY